MKWCLRTIYDSLGKQRAGPGSVVQPDFTRMRMGASTCPKRGPRGNIFADKPAIMNEAVRQLQESPGRWVDSVVAFGGNMLFGRKLFRRVGFDPGITRGEDFDYVLNARLAGYKFWLDKCLRISHLPPKQHDTPPYVKLAEDIRRFLYELRN